MLRNHALPHNCFDLLWAQVFLLFGCFLLLFVHLLRLSRHVLLLLFRQIFFLLRRYILFLLSGYIIFLFLACLFLSLEYICLLLLLKYIWLFLL